jgi:hypothetical protein
MDDTGFFSFTGFLITCEIAAIVVGMAARPDRWRPIATAGGFLLAVTLSVVALLPAGRVVLDSSCGAHGPVALFKSVAQGRMFWEEQLKHLDEQIAWQAAEPERQAQLDELKARMRAEEDRVVKEAQQEMERIYQQYPSLRPRPSAAEVTAQALRDQADALEQADLAATVERLRAQFRAEEIRKLKGCRTIVAARLAR